MRGLKPEKYEAALNYLQRMLKEPHKAQEILVTHETDAAEQLALCSDLHCLHAWIERHLNDTGWKRLQNALNQRRCSTNLQRMSLKKSTYAALAKLAKEQRMTINETVEHLLQLQKAESLVTHHSAEPAEAEDVSEEMLIWMMARSSGVES
jgi:macrodomain Ter protein organizer (MatP/YcbG family)